MTTHAGRTRWWLASFLMLAALCALAGPAWAEAWNIQVDASPQRLVFGSTDRVSITVTVEDSHFHAAPESTPVYFYTTLGTLPSVAYTKNGKVFVWLDNTDSAGQATVTITVGDSRQTVTVEYLGPAGELPPVEKKPHYTLTAESGYYGVDTQIFDLCDNAVFSCRDYSVMAERIWYDLKGGRVVASGSVTVRAKDKTISGRNLVLDVESKSCSMVQVAPDIKFVTFKIPELTATESAAARDADYRALDPQPTHTWIICHKAVVYPHTMIQFHHPEFYANNYNHRLYALPFHVIDLRNNNEATFFNANFSLTSDAGLNVDFPVYYSASENRLGAVHLRHVAMGSPDYLGTTGWQTSIEEEYLAGDRGDGAINFEDLTHGTRGVNWDHKQQIGTARFDFSASDSKSDPTTPYTTRFGLNATESFRKTNYALNSSWSSFEGTQQSTTELTASPKNMRLGRRDVTLGLSPYIGYNTDVTGAGTAGGTTGTTSGPLAMAVRDTGTTGTGGTTTESTPSYSFYQGVRANLGLPSERILGNVVTTTLSDEVVHSTAGVANTVDTEINFRRRITRAFSTSLDYSYDFQTGHTTAATSTGSTSGISSASSLTTRRLGLNITGQGTGWTMNTYASYDDTAKAVRGSANLSRDLPWFVRHGGVRRTTFTYTSNFATGSAGTTDQQFTLGYRVGLYSVLLHYSPTGNTGVTGIGTASGKTFALELAQVGY